ncbi:MAG: SH3 domain-containing protein [Tateyamaria sp.]|uniref:SH3 domain-containing protein n=1 Tax=Tateyamaria sp. TaxID=1929288 RepID=UPI00329CC0AF
MQSRIFPVILVFMSVAGCSDIVTDRTVVTGAGPDEMLKLRAGPGLDYNVVLGLPDGTSLNRRACVTEVGQLWCQVSLTAAPQIIGYVSADYLSDS